MTISRAELRALPLRVDPTAYDLGDAAGTVASGPQRWSEMLFALDDIPGGALFALEGLAESLRSAGGEGADLPTLATAVQLQLRELAKVHGDRTNMVEALGADHPLVEATVETDRLLSLAGRAVAEQFCTPQEGRVVRLGISGGGVPKRSTDAAEITMRGLGGDSQADRRNHGRPFQAVCLYSLEVINALAAEGHPISAGSVGENVTVSGLDWGALRVGNRLVFTGSAVDGSGGASGTEVQGVAPLVLEITSWTDPCKTIAESFVDRDFRRIKFSEHPGESRAYAAVVVPGWIHSNSVVRCLP